MPRAANLGAKGAAEVEVRRRRCASARRGAHCVKSKPSASRRPKVSSRFLFVRAAPMALEKFSSLVRTPTPLGDPNRMWPPPFVLARLNFDTAASNCSLAVRQRTTDAHRKNQRRPTNKRRKKKNLKKMDRSRTFVPGGSGRRVEHARPCPRCCFVPPVTHVRYRTRASILLKNISYLCRVEKFYSEITPSYDDALFQEQLFRSFISPSTYGLHSLCRAIIPLCPLNSSKKT